MLIKFISNKKPGVTTHIVDKESRFRKIHEGLEQWAK